MYVKMLCVVGIILLLLYSLALFIYPKLTICRELHIRHDVCNVVCIYYVNGSYNHHSYIGHIKNDVDDDDDDDFGDAVLSALSAHEPRTRRS